jgi:hypothetical protein
MGFQRCPTPSPRCSSTLSKCAHRSRLTAQSYCAAAKAIASGTSSASMYLLSTSFLAAGAALPTYCSRLDWRQNTARNASCTVLAGCVALIWPAVLAPMDALGLEKFT